MLVARCQGHNSWVSAVAFDPWRCDDRNYRFGSVGEDARLLLWDFSVGMLHRPRAVWPRADPHIRDRFRWSLANRVLRVTGIGPRKRQYLLAHAAAANPTGQLDNPAAVGLQSDNGQRRRRRRAGGAPCRASGPNGHVTAGHGEQGLRPAPNENCRS